MWSRGWSRESLGVLGTVRGKVTEALDFVSCQAPSAVCGVKVLLFGGRRFW